MDNSRKKRIGLTGGTGVLGSILKKKYNNLYTIDCFKGDIRNTQEIKEWLSSIEHIDAIIHLAALVSIKDVNNRPFDAYHINVGGTINLLASIKELAIKPWVFYCSTSHVYKSNPHRAIKEEDETKPMNIYGETKLAAERVIEEYQQQENKRVCIGRVFSMYHDSQKPPFLFPSILERVKKHNFSERFKLAGALNIRDFLNAEEVADIIVDLYEKKAEGTFNIASGIPMTVRDFVLQYVNQDVEIVCQNKPTSSLHADISKLKAIQGHE